MPIKNYIPAFRYKWLTPFFDLFLRWTMPEIVIKTRLVKEISLPQNDSRILDLGCGTGTLTILLKKTFPKITVVGLDGDPKVLQIARKKTLNESLSIAFDEGMAYSLPYEDHTFDVVVSSLVFHHLTREDKLRTLEQIFRVLRPGGALLIADFGEPKTFMMKFITLIMRNFEETADNFLGLMPQLISQSGFSDEVEFAAFTTVFGPVSLLKATKTKS
jgi:ubiquinone/menaquinone biosynthesis C-methylase UbiE